MWLLWGRVELLWLLLMRAGGSVRVRGGGDIGGVGGEIGVHVNVLEWSGGGSGAVSLGEGAGALLRWEIV